MEKIEIREQSRSGKGKTNEDCMLCKSLHENCVVAILADGMGGLSHGAEAAVTVALVINNTLYYAWQGNVRLYLSRGGKLSMLTKDHAVTHSMNTFLTRCVNGRGFREPVPVEKMEMEPGDTVYLCSDGFYAALSGNELLTTCHNLSIYEREDDASLIELRVV